MNERVKELFNQARASVTSRDGILTPDAVRDEFAKSIVQECAGIYSKIDNGNLHMGTDDYLDALHKHFGAGK